MIDLQQDLSEITNHPMTFTPGAVVHACLANLSYGFTRNYPSTDLYKRPGFC